MTAPRRNGTHLSAWATAYFPRTPRPGDPPVGPHPRVGGARGTNARHSSAKSHRRMCPMSRYAGRVAVVTGSARGIGAATARRFAEEGASVAVLDLDEGDAAKTASGLGAAKAVGVACNVSDAASVEAAVASVVEQLGTVDVLVNNAGVTRDNLLFKLTEDDWDAVMNVHLRGSFLMSREVQKHMVAQKYGKIVNLSSVSALGNRGQANYSAAKMGLQGFTRTLALELGPFGINVN